MSENKPLPGNIWKARRKQKCVRGFIFILTICIKWYLLEIPFCFRNEYQNIICALKYVYKWNGAQWVKLLQYRCAHVAFIKSVYNDKTHGEHIIELCTYVHVALYKVVLADQMYYVINKKGMLYFCFLNSCFHLSMEIRVH